MKIIDCLLPSLRAVIDDEQKLDRVMSHWIAANRGQWSSRDTALFAEALPYVVRWWSLLRALASSVGFSDDSPLGAIAVYQAMNPSMNLRREQLSTKQMRTLEHEYNRLYEHRAIRESIPDWLDTHCSHELGPAWPDTLRALNAMPSIVLRANLLRTDRQSLMAMLANEGYRPAPLGSNEAIELRQRANIFKSSAFRQGYFEQQDLGSQAVAHFMQLEPGQRVVDACAGNGGKTLHMASLMGNRGRIIALDVAEHKLATLRQRAARAGCTMVETRTIDSAKVVKRLAQTAERVLLDVPCSGLGVLRRNPDIKWHLNPARLIELRQMQHDLLLRYSSMVRPGGKLVYATCSVLPSEGTEQVQRFLKQCPDAFALEAEQQLSPLDGTDGFYMARLARLA